MVIAFVFVVRAFGKTESVAFALGVQLAFVGAVVGEADVFDVLDFVSGVFEGVE